MQYTLLLWPHANVRYRTEAQRLARAELSILLGAAGEDVSIEETTLLDLPALSVHTPAPLSEAQLARVRMHSLLYGLFECREDGLLSPVAGREPALLGEDLPGVLKYKGKTNELFTQLLMNVACASLGPVAPEGEIRLLDPMCGRGTTLFVGVNRGWNCTGSDVDRADLKEAEQYFKRYLEYHRIKHSLKRGSLTISGGRPAPFVQFEGPAQLRLAQLDCAHVRQAFGKRAFHLIVCDLPYGVQHAAQGGRPEQLLERALPGWREALLPGGVAAVSFNAQTLDGDQVRRRMADAGFEPMDGEAWRSFGHWVEQAVTRDLVVARR